MEGDGAVRRGGVVGTGWVVVVGGVLCDGSTLGIVALWLGQRDTLGRDAGLLG